MIDFDAWSGWNEDEKSEVPAKKRNYKIEYDGDAVQSINTEDHRRLGLKRFGDNWLIHEIWGTSSRTEASDDVSD